jgi:hypothetical protein
LARRVFESAFNKPNNMKKSLFFSGLMFLVMVHALAQPINDEPCGAITIPVESTGCEPTTIYSYTGATFSTALGNTYCNGSANRDVFYKAIVPSTGSITVAVAYSTASNMAVEMLSSTSCSALTLFNTTNNGFPCLYSNSNDKITYVNLVPGSTVYLRLYVLYDVNIATGNIKICVSNPSALADEPCSAGFFDVDPADPLSQNCVPYKQFSWIGASLTPAIPNPGCLYSGYYPFIRDVWFKVKVPPTGKLKINMTDCSYLIQVFTATACNGTFTDIGCINCISPGVYNSLVPNSIIYCRVFFNSSATQTDGSVKICVAEGNQVPGINNGQKVGIGIDTPFAKLDVVGTGIFRDKLTAGNDMEVRGNLVVQGNIIGKYGTTSLTTPVNLSGRLLLDSLAFNNRLGNHLSLYGGLGSGGHYGMGIQNSLLQVYSDAANSNISFGYGNSNSFTERARIINNGSEGMVLNGRMSLKNGTTDINNGPGIWLYNPTNSALLGFIGTQNAGNIGFYGGPGAWGFVYDALNSRVGIGTSSPTSLLDVNGQLTIDQKNFGGYGGLLIKGNAPGSNYPNISFSIKNNAATPADVVSAMIQGELVNNAAGAETIDITFLNSQTGLGGLSEKMRIKANGNVGIGNNNPLKPLSFPAALGEKILLYPGGAGEVGIGVYGNELRLHADNPGAKVSFGTQDNAGVFDQTALAQRNGAYAFSVLGSLWVNGTTYASDERFKQNISSISSPLQKLLELNGVEYEMKTGAFPQFHFTAGRQIGLLAQNVEKIIPEAVNEMDGYKGVDYARLVPLLIEAIREQNKRIDDLQKLVNEHLSSKR